MLMKHFFIVAREAAAVARAIIIVKHIKGTALSNKNKRYKCYQWVSVFCGYSDRTKYYKSSYKSIRGEFPAPNGKYTGYKYRKK